MPEPLSDEEFLAGSLGGGAESEQDEKNRINTH
jgi:ATP-dependent Lon protease